MIERKYKSGTQIQTKFEDRKVVASEKCVLILCNIAGRNGAPGTK